MTKSRLVLCSGIQATKQTSTSRSDYKVVELDTLDPNSNTHLRLENVTGAFARSLPPRMVDLLELATYVYTADCEAARASTWTYDKSTEPWSRDFHIIMPVRDLEFWSRHDVTEKLVSALGFLSSDRFTLEFVKLERKRSSDGYLDVIDIDDTPFHQVDRVIMFSGGLDSLAGAVETAAAGGSLVLVSHRSAAQMDKRQRDLVANVKEKYRVPIMHIPVWVNKTGFDREPTQRTRSFLFSALGVVVASVINAGGVRFYENGVISLNWPLADEVMRSRASRSTHPESLRRLQDFYRLVVDSADFSIDNPFIFKTKTEVVSVIGEKNAGDLIRHSCSCVHTMFQPKDQWHCGLCGQCIDRRIAILASGLEGYDTGDDYASDVFTGHRPVHVKSPYDHNIAVHYARFASEIGKMSEREVGTSYNLELARVARCFPNAGNTAQKFIEMHKRHASAVCGVLDDQIKLHSEEFVDGSLDKTSLLAMIGRREHVEPIFAEQDDMVGQASAELSVIQETVSVSTPSVPDHGSNFRASADYRSVWLNGRAIKPLTPMQAEIVRILDEARKAHQPTMTHSAILSKMDIPTNRISDVFRGNDPRTKLIKRVGKDTYRLNI